MKQLADALHLAAIVLERRGLLAAGVPRELAIAVALETAVAASSNAARDLAETLEIAAQIDAIAKRDFGVATTTARGAVIKRLLGSAPKLVS